MKKLMSLLLIIIGLCTLIVLAGRIVIVPLLVTLGGIL